MKQKKYILSLRTKLLASVIGVVLLFLSFSTYFSIVQTGEIIKEQNSSYGNSMARTLSDFCIEHLLSWNYPALQLSIDYIGEQDTQILGIKIFHQNSVVAEYISSDYSQETTKELEEKYETSVTIVSHDEKRDLGKVQVFLSKEKYNDFLYKEIRLLLILAFVLLIGDTILSYLTVKILILNPLRTITKGTKEIGHGNFNYHINIKNKDEIGELADEVNNMTRNLKNIKGKLTAQTKNLKKTQNTLISTLKDTEIAKEKIEEEEHKIAAMIANLVDPVIVMDNNRRIILLNPSAKKILKIDTKDIGRKIPSAKHEDCELNHFCLCDFKGIIKVPYKSSVTQVSQENYPIVEELTIGENSETKEKMENDNSVFKVFTSPVKDDRGVIFGYMKIFYDLTREKRIDNLKSKFISVAAHQLRTPSSGVKWALSLILGGDAGEISEESREYIEKAAQANERMVKLINDLLNISRMETGKIVYSLEKTSFVKLVNEVVKDAGITLEEKEIEIELRYLSKKLPNINIDPKRIKVAIQNLVTNAIKYSKKGGKVKINIYTPKTDKTHLYFDIEDDGIGIGKEDQEKLFGRFFRCDNAIRSQTEGSGLGLYIVKGIVEAHKGKIWYESEIDKGSHFHIKLPINLEEIKKV